MTPFLFSSGRRGVSGKHLRAAVVAALLAAASLTGSHAAQTSVAPGAMYFTMSPCRLLDTRSGSPLVDGVPMTVTAAGQCGIPAGASAIAFNPVAISPTGDGFFQFYSGSTPPTTSSINFRAGKTRASNAIVDLDAAGAFTARPIVSGGGSVDLVVDVFGYFFLPPQAVNDTYQTPKDTALPVAPPGVLGNDVGAGLQAVPFIGPTAHGNVAIVATGGFTYQPNVGYTGPDSFTYTVQNIAGSATGSVSISVTDPSAITSANAATFKVGTAGTFTVTTTGYPIPSISRMSGSFPTGVQLTDNGNGTATIAGTPAAGTGGVYPVTLDASNGVGPDATQVFTLTVDQAPAITSAASTTFTVGSAGTFTVTTSGFPPVATISETGALPANVSFTNNGDGTATLAGTPVAGTSGDYPITINASNGVAPNASQSFTLHVVCAGVTVNPSTLPGGTSGALYSQTVTGSGGAAPYTFAVTSGTIPAGLGFDGSTGILSGTLTLPGPYSFTITATDANGCQGSRAYSVTIVCPTVSVTPATLPGGTVGVAYSQGVAGSGGTAPYTFTVTAGALPTNVNLNSSTGALTGSPTAAGTFGFTITATDANGCSGSQAYSVQICPAITVAPASLPDGVINVPYPTQTVTASGGTGPYTFTVSVGSLPSGLNLDSATGDITGTPDTLGSSTFTIRATQTDGCFGERQYTVRTCVAQTLTPPPGALADATQGSPYSSGVTASGGAGPYSYAVTAGSLPHNLAINPGTGAITGTPDTLGNSSFTVTATDGATGCTVAGGYSIRVCATITVSPSTLPAGVAGTAYSQTVSASGGVGPYTFAVTSGSLPANLNLDGSTGAITGTPVSAGSFPFTITATDSNGCTGSRAYTLQICPVITLAPLSSVCAAVGVSFNQTVVPSGGAGPYTFAITSGSLPANLGINPSTGVISGSPTTAGNSTFTVTATDANGCTGSQSYTIPVLGLGPAGPALPDATFGSSYTQAFTVTGGTGPFSFAVTSGSVPNGLAISGNQLTGTPSGATGTGAFGFTITATDSSNGCTVARAYTLTSRPVAVGDSYGNGVGNTEYYAGGFSTPTTPFVSSATNILTNDLGPSLTATIVTQPANGAVTLNSNGSFRYTPTAGAQTSASFTYKVTSNGVDSGSNATVTITLNGRVWYVNGSGVNGIGTSNSPFNRVNNAQSPSASGDTIFVHSSSFPAGDGIALKSSQTLWGQGTAFSLSGLTIGSSTFPAITGTVTLANSVTTNGIDLSTGSSNAITGTGVSSIAVTARNVTTTTGTAVTIAGSGNGGTMTFTQVNANGAANGITIQNYAGGFTVTGDGGGSSNGSGGTIQGTTGHAISLANVSGTGVSLGYMNITNPGATGIQAAPVGWVFGTNPSGLGVNNFTLNRCNLSDAAGDVTKDDGVRLENGTGNLSITNSSIAGSRHQGITIDNVNQNIASMTIQGNTVNGTPGGDGVLIQMRGTSVMTTGAFGGASAALGNTISSNSATGLQVANADSGNIAALNIQNNTVTGNNAGIDLDLSQTSSMTVTVQNNTLTNQHTQVINMVQSTGSTGGTLNATIRSNVIGIQGTFDSGSQIGSGIRVANGAVNVNVTIDSNTIREVSNASGIELGAQAYSVTGNVKYKIVNNVIARPSGSSLAVCGGAPAPCPASQVFILSDSNGLGGFDHVCTTISGNTVYDPTSWPNGAGQAAFYFARRTSASNTLQLEGTQPNARLQILATNTITNPGPSPSSSDVIDENTSGTVTIVPAGTCGVFPP